MPELPEVETIRRGLKDFIVHKKIMQVKVREGKSWVGDVRVVEGAEIMKIGRRGKALLIELNNGWTLMIHLRMTGQLIWVPRGDDLAERFAGGHPSENFVSELPNKQTRIEVVMDGGTLYFNDQRKFGSIKVLKTEEVPLEKFIRELAPEPAEMSEEEWWERLQKHKGMMIKAALLDQKIIAGLGNIYADETLYTAGIHPERRVGDLNQEQAKHILLSARQVLKMAIGAGGSTLATYVQADGSRGNYLDKYVKAYHREGARCERCGGEIKKMRVAGRGTYYCPRCQKLDGGRRMARGRGL